MGIMLTKKITRAKRILAHLFTFIIIVSSIGNHTIRAYAAEEILLEEASLEADRIAAEQAAAQAEAERIAAEQAAAAHAEAEAQAIAEAERIAQEEAEAAALAEAERFAEEQAEAERIAQEQAQAEAGVQENTDPVYDDNVGDGAYSNTEAVNEKYQESATENEITEEGEPGMPHEEEFRVTIFYEASEGGSVSIAEETLIWKEITTTDENGNTTFTQDPEFVTVQGSTAQADEDYEFAGWSLNGEIVSEDESFVPVAPAADVVYQAQFTQSYPAQSWEGETRDVLVSASVEEGVFPAGTVMVVAPIRKQEAIAAAQDMVGEETAVVDAVAVDITFRDKNDREIQPNGAVNVHLTPKKKLQGESHDAITIDEKGEASVVEDAEADENGSDIVTEHFTVYGVIGTEEPYDDSVKTQARHTYRFHAGAPTADPADWPVVDTRIVRDGDTLTLPTDPAGDAKHTFAGWFKADTEGNLTDKEVTEGEIKIESAENAQNTQAKDETIDVYAKFSTKYEITLYTDDTKTTVYETHLRDKGESVESLPKKEDDDFDLHIADGSDFIGWKIDGTDDADLVSEVTIDAEHPEDIDLVPVFASINQVKFEVNPANQEGVVATKIPTQNVPFDGTATEPHAFEKGKEYNGYAFQGWFESCDLNDATGEYEYGAEFDFTSVIDKETTLYAKWEPKTVTFRVEIHQEKQDVVGEYALKYTASASETESYSFKGAPGARIDADTIKRILEYNQQKRGTEKFHLSRTGETDDSGNDPYAIEIWQDGARIAEYDAATGTFVSGEDDAKISSNGTTVVKVYESRDTYFVHFLFRYGSGNAETYNVINRDGTGYEQVTGYKRSQNAEKTLDGQVYVVRYKDNLYRTVYMNEVNPVNEGKDNTVIQELMDGPWVFKGDYFRSEGGQSTFHAENSSYNFNPKNFAENGDNLVCLIEYNASKIPHPFKHVYLDPNGDEIKEKETNHTIGYADRPHTHNYSIGSTGGGYKLIQVDNGRETWTENNKGSGKYQFTYDNGKANTMTVTHQASPFRITFDPNDGASASFYAKNDNWPGYTGQYGENAFFVGDPYSQVVEDQVEDQNGAGAARYTVGHTEVIGGVLKVFEGWYNNKSGTGDPVVFTDEDNESKTMPANNLYFYGKWTPVECKVIFHPNNGEDDTEQIVFVNTKANRIPNPEKAGETFGGWYLDDETFEKRYDFGTVLDLETVAKLETKEGSKEIHLYALWNSKQSYSVVYHVDHEDGEEFAESLQNALNENNEDKEKYRGGASASVKGAAQKAAKGSLQYVFTGWVVGNAQSDVVLQSGEPFPANSAYDKQDGTEDQVIHLYAQFKPMEKKTTVTYHANYPQNGGDETKQSEELVVNETFEISGPGTLDFTKVQEEDRKFVFRAENGCEFRFVRWTNSAGETISGTNGAGREYFTPGQRAAAGADNNNLYAVWEVVQEYIEISGTKTWEDANNQDGMRPELVQVTLLADGNPASTTPEANGRRNPTPVRANGAEGNVWLYQWTHLPKYDTATGEVINYTVTEDTVAEYDEPVIEGNMTDGFNIINTHTPAKTEVSVTKAWEDANNRDGIRPESVRVQLYKSGAEGEPVAEGAPVTLDENNGWSSTWNDLDKMAGGADITYTVAELDAEGNAITNGETLATSRAGQTYAVAITGGKENTDDGFFNYTVTNTHEPEVTTVSGTKTWSDADNQDGMRPESITVTLLAGEEIVAATADANGRNNPTTVTPDANGKWSYAWTNLPKYAAGKNGEVIQYTVREEAVTGYDAKVSGANITNEHTPMETQVTVTKKWEDENNRDGIRPESVQVQLYKSGAEGEPVAEGAPVKLNAENNWSHTWEGLAKKAGGRDITYTVAELDADGNAITNGGTLPTSRAGQTYTVAITGGKDEAKDGVFNYTITNTHEPEMTEVNGTKVWDDADNQDAIRPESITVNLLAGGSVVDTAIVTADSEWTFVFTNLSKYENGEEIEYSIEETEIKGYQTNISGDVTDGFVITNVHEPAETSVTVTKSWDDAENQDGIRPESVMVQLLADNDPDGEAVTLNESNNWSHTWSGLDAKKAGNDITYTVAEPTVAEGYTVVVSGGKDEGENGAFNYTVTNTHEPAKTEVTVTKIWDDENNRDGIRPDAVQVQLYKDEAKEGEPVSLNSDNNWSHTWEELPKKENGTDIAYTVAELDAEGNAIPDGETLATSRASQTYTVAITGGKENTDDGFFNYTVTNTHESELITVEGTKTWNDKDDQDGVRPKSITVRLHADGPEVKSETVRAAEDGTWSYAFVDVPKYADGKEITYTVTEDALSGYSTAINGFEITNSYTPRQTSVTVTKSWDDANNQDGIRPGSVDVQLFEDDAPYGNAVPHGDAVTLNEKNSWSHTWSELDERSAGSAIRYTVREVGEIAGYTPSVSGNETEGNASETAGNNTEDGAQETAGNGEAGYTAETTGNATKGFTITNSHTPEETAVSVEKIWNDTNNQDGIRPQSVTVNLYANNEFKASAEVEAEGDWKYTFTNLPKNQEGKAITYTVKENEVEGYTTAIAGKAEAGFTITNTHKPETLEVSVRKEWDDNDDQDGLRPETVAVTLHALAGGEPVEGIDGREETVAAQNGWSYTFKELPKYHAGTEITYTVTEEEGSVPDGYEVQEITGSVTDGFVITNTHAPEMREISVNKTWVDNDDQDGKRPETITVNLIADGNQEKPVRTERIQAGEDGSFSHIFTDLPKYRDGGKEIVYTVNENAVAEYETAIAGNAEAGFTITNTHEPETLAISVKKDWVDDSDRDGLRPATVTATLHAIANETRVNGVDGREGIIAEANNWRYTFEKLPKYHAGTEITYTVTEEEGNVPAGYEVQEITGSVTDGFVITNTHAPATREISVNKIWDDSENQDGKRPGTITVNLIADGNEQRPVQSESIAADEDGSFSHTFTNLPVYRDGGTEIVYTVTENAVAEYETAIAGSVGAGFTITNTHAPETLAIVVNKKWEDAENQDGIRPEAVKVTLHAVAGEEPVGDVDGRTETVAAENNWSYKFENLPKYHAGTEITYTVKEEAADIPDNYRLKGITGSVTDGFTITNEHTPETTGIFGTKTWDDDENRDGERPESITVNLLADGVQIDSKEVTEKDGWFYDFTGLPKYAVGAVGKEITYTLTENEVKEYTPAYNGYDITNTHAPGQTSVTVTKVWEDDHNRDGIRPAVRVQLLADEEASGNPVTLTEENNWTHTWNVFERSGGKDITYTVAELDAEGNAIADGGTLATNREGQTYQVAYEKAEDGNNWTVTNTHTPETVDLEGTKIWEDADNQDGMRPESIKVTLLANGVAVEGLNETDHNSENPATVTAGENGNWTYKWTNLPKYAGGEEIRYTVTEDAVAEYDEPVIAGSVTDGFTVTNTHTPEVIDVDVTTRWVDENDQDGIRPAAVAVRLYADGKEVTGLAGNDNATVTVNEGNGWSKKWEGLPKYKDGKLIQYSVRELTAVEDGDAIDEAGTLPTERDGQTYTVTYQNNHDYSFVITNTHEPETFGIPVEKSWDDDSDRDGLRPDTITATLHAVVNGTRVNGVDGKAGVIADANKWTYTFKDLPKYHAGTEITYTVTEEEGNVPDGYEVQKITGSVTGGFTITNTHAPATREISVNKVWIDNENQDGKRPGTITVNVIADGDEQKPVRSERIQAGADGSFSHTFTNLPVYRDGGKEIVYTVTENAVAGYETAIEGSVEAGFTITNTHTPETLAIVVNKEWEDANNQDGIRPPAVTVTLHAVAGEEPVEDVDGRAETVAAQSNWSYTFENLPKYHAGTEITYTVKEEEADIPDDYRLQGITGSVTDGFTITNAHTPETIEISGTKTWDDDDNRDGERPESITVNLLADGETIDSKNVTEEDEWSYKWTDLPKFAEGAVGHEIKYTLTEETVEEYTTESDGYDIINTHAPGQTSVTVTKKWEDDHNRDGLRPDAVEVALLADGVQSQTVALTEENNWTHTWNVFVKSGGETIAYTVAELDAEGEAIADGGTLATDREGRTYQVTYEKAEGGNNWTVTNTYTPETTGVTVEKNWDDNSNRDGIRPENVRVMLFADGEPVTGNEEVIAEATLDEAGSWTHTWENLPKYDAGTEITYTVEELDANDNPVGNGGTLTTTRDGQFYDVAISSEHTEDGSFSHTITNTHTPEVIDVDVTTRWVDENNQDGIRPAAVAVRLFADGVEVTGLADDNATVTVNEGNGWSKKWTGLPKYKDGKPIQYSVKELTAVENGDEIDENGTLPTIREGQTYAVTYQKNNDYSFVITNTHEPETVEVPVTKTWSDVDNQDGKRPDEVTVMLHADGTAVKSVSVAAGGDAESATGEENTEGNTEGSGKWTYTFTGLPKYKAGQAEAIAYTVTEANVPAGYTEAVTGNMAEGFVITNTHVPEVIEIAGTKTWNDEDDRENVRPDSITVRLYADDNEIEKQVVTPDEDGNWAYSFGEQPRYAAGKEITYTVTENAIAHYVPSFSGFDITNTYTPEKPDDPEDPGDDPEDPGDDPEDPGDDPEDPEEPVENTNVATRIVTPDGIPVRTVTTTGVTPEAQTEARNLPNLAAIPAQDPADLPTPQSAVPNGLPDPGLPNVMGQTRRTTALDTISGAQVRNINDPEVLGGRRGKTGDGSDASKAMTILAAGMMALALAQKKKRKEDKSEKEG